MRVVCSFAGGAGHLAPQIPLYRALANAGHQLTLLGRASAMSAVPASLITKTIARPDRRTTIAHNISPLVPVNVTHELAVIGRHFAGEAAVRAATTAEPELEDADLVVCDEVDFGVIAAAQKTQTPVAVVSIIASGALVRPELLTAPLEALRHRLDVARPIRPRGDFFIIPFAPAMRDPRFRDPADSLWMRPEAGPAPQPDGSIVATLGTEFNTESGDLFDRILAALAYVGAAATVAIGRDLDPARFGDQPSHVQVEQYVDLDALISRADVVLHHGGSGLFLRSVMGRSAQIVFPMGADQPFTADRIRDLHVGQVLDPLQATPRAIAAAITNLRTDTRTHNNTETLRRSALALPTPAAVVDHLESAISRSVR